MCRICEETYTKQNGNFSEEVNRTAASPLSEGTFERQSSRLSLQRENPIWFSREWCCFCELVNGAMIKRTTSHVSVIFSCLANGKWFCISQRPTLNLCRSNLGYGHFVMVDERRQLLQYSVRNRSMGDFWMNVKEIESCGSFSHAVQDAILSNCHMGEISRMSVHSAMGKICLRW